MSSCHGSHCLFIVPLQFAECLGSAKDIVKYFKNKTVVHGLLDKARKHVKVSACIALEFNHKVCMTGSLEYYRL